MAIPELIAVDTPHADFTVTLSPSTEELIDPHGWTNHWYLPDGTVWLAFAKVEAGYQLRFPELADFVVSSDARSICCYPRRRLPRATVRHLLLNQVIPLVISQLGRLVLHAAACATHQGTIAFMATTGMGKSTLATSFALQGYPIVADDCLLVEDRQGTIMSVPSYPGVRLWPESVSALFKQEPALQPLAHYTEKKRLLFHQRQPDGPIPLTAVYVLSQPDATSDAAQVAIEPLRTSEALFEIVKHTFLLDPTDPENLRRCFRQYEWLANAVPFFRLAFPRQHAYLSSVNQAILNHLQTLHSAVPARALTSPAAPL